MEYLLNMSQLQLFMLKKILFKKIMTHNIDYTLNTS